MNGSCSDYCPLSYIQLRYENKKLCIFPCSLSQYLFINGTCSDNCPVFFHQRSEQTIHYCDFPCASGEYLFYNGTCSNSCPFPLVMKTEAQSRYCELPCEVSQYISETGSCLDTCLSPMKHQVDQGLSFCHGPCSNLSMYYYPTEDTCKSGCQDPYIAVPKDLYNMCKLQDTFSSVRAAITNTTKIVIYSVVATSVLYSGSSFGITTAVIAKMLIYIKYLDLNYSEGLKLVLETWKTNFISVALNADMPASIQKEFEAGSLPEVFNKWDIKPSFFMNFWAEALFFAIFTGILITLIVLIYNKSKHETAKYSYTVPKKLIKINQNVLMIFLYNSFGDIVFFATLQFYSNNFISRWSILSFSIAIFFIAIMLLILRRHIKYLIENNNLRKQGAILQHNTEENQDLYQKYSFFYAIYKDFKDRYLSQHMFLFFFVMRDIIFSIVIALLYKYPLVQVLIIMVLNIAILLYTFIYRPFKRFVDFFQQLISELVLMLTNSSVLVIAIMDYTEVQDIDLRDHLGNIIIFANLAFNVVSIFTLVIKILLEVRDFWREYKQNRKRTKVVPLIGLIKSSELTHQKFKDSQSQSQSHAPDQHHSLSLSPKKLRIREPSQFRLIRVDGTDNSFKNYTEIETEQGTVDYKHQYSRKDTAITIPAQRLLDTVCVTEPLDTMNQPGSLKFTEEESEPVIQIRMNIGAKKNFSRVVSEFSKPTGSQAGPNHDQNIKSDSYLSNSDAGTAYSKTLTKIYGNNLRPVQKITAASNTAQPLFGIDDQADMNSNWYTKLKSKKVVSIDSKGPQICQLLSEEILDIGEKTNEVAIPPKIPLLEFDEPEEDPITNVKPSLILDAINRAPKDRTPRNQTSKNPTPRNINQLIKNMFDKDRSHIPAVDNLESNLLSKNSLTKTTPKRGLAIQFLLNKAQLPESQDSGNQNADAETFSSQCEESLKVIATQEVPKESNIMALPASKFSLNRQNIDIISQKPLKGVIEHVHIEDNTELFMFDSQKALPNHGKNRKPIIVSKKRRHAFLIEASSVHDLDLSLKEEDQTSSNSDLAAEGDLPRQTWIKKEKRTKICHESKASQSLNEI